MGLREGTSAQQHKDFRKLESTIVKMCTDQCLRRELHYETHTEFCMVKCYDLSFHYMRHGIAAFVEFAQENNIKS